MEITVMDVPAERRAGLAGLLLGSIRRNAKQYTMFLSLLAIWVIFQVLTEGDFLQFRNLSNLSLQTVTTAVAAVGVVLVIVAGHIDLSIGSVLGFTGAVCAMLMINETTAFGVSAAIGVTLLVGLAIGAWHGFWVAYRRVPSFIVTLASQLAFRGLIISITGGQTQGLEMAPAESAERFKLLGQGYVPTILPAEAGQWHDTSAYIVGVLLVVFWVVSLKGRADRRRYGFTVLPFWAELLRLAAVSAAVGAFSLVWILYLGIPWAVILVLVLTVVFAFIARNTRFGRHLYAIGGNADAARLSGISVGRNVFFLFCLMGVMEAVTGVIYTSRLNAATTSAGVNAELDAIAAAVIGGTSLMGGEGTIFGAIVGALVMSSLDNGMSLMNLDVTWQYLVKGLVLLLAVWVDMAQRRK